MKTKLTFLFVLGLILNLQAQWERAADVDFDRNHGIGFSIDGIGYILTGWQSQTVSTKSFHKYDPIANAWEQLPDYPGPGRGYGIGDVYEDKLYFGFGLTVDEATDITSELNDLWVYDPADDSFTELPSCPCARRAHPAFLVVDGIIYMGTGSSPVGDLNDWWSYNIESQIWTRLSNIPGRRHHPFMFDIDGDIYVGSGHRVDWFKYDVSSDSWDALPKLDDRVAGTQFSYKGKGYALSGVDNYHQNYDTGEFWMFDPELNEWSELPPHPGASRWAPASFIIDSYVYLVSGWSNVAEEPQVWKYDLDQGVTSSIEISNQLVDIEIYPNPVADIINIKGDSNFESNKVNRTVIYDIEGKKVFAANGFQNSVDVSQFNSGSYILELQFDETVFNQTFIKH